MLSVNVQHRCGCYVHDLQLIILGVIIAKIASPYLSLLLQSNTEKEVRIGFFIGVDDSSTLVI